MTHAAPKRPLILFSAVFVFFGLATPFLIPGFALAKESLKEPLSQTDTPAKAPEPAAATKLGPRTTVVQIKGGITPELIPKVKEAVAKATGDPLPAGLIVFLDSPGGDGLAAIEVGRILREAQAHIFVSGKCSSACVFIFMGGVVRQANDGALGIHRARITRIDKDTKKRVDVDINVSPRAKQKLDEGNQKIRAYVQDMGVLAQFSAAMDEVPPEKMRWLTRREGKDLGIIGFDPGYLKLRDAYLVERLKAQPGDLERNTDRVMDRCFDEIAKPQGNFVRCYRLSLNRP